MPTWYDAHLWLLDQGNHIPVWLISLDSAFARGVLGLFA